MTLAPIEAERPTPPLPGINWLKYLALSALVVGAILSGVLALTIYLVSQNARSLRDESRQAKNVCIVVHALDPLIVSARDATQKAVDDGTYDRLIARGDLPSDAILSAKKTIGTYSEAHTLLLSLTCA